MNSVEVATAVIRWVVSHLMIATSELVGALETLDHVRVIYRTCWLPELSVALKMIRKAYEKVKEVIGVIRQYEAQ